MPTTGRTGLLGRHSTIPIDPQLPTGRFRMLNSAGARKRKMGGSTRLILDIREPGTRSQNTQGGGHRIGIRGRRSDNGDQAAISDSDAGVRIDNVGVSDAPDLNVLKNIAAGTERSLLQEDKLGGGEGIRW